MLSMASPRSDCAIPDLGIFMRILQTSFNLHHSQDLNRAQA